MVVAGLVGDDVLRDSRKKGRNRFAMRFIQMPRKKLLIGMAVLVRPSIGSNLKYRRNQNLRGAMLSSPFRQTYSGGHAMLAEIFVLQLEAERRALEFAADVRAPHFVPFIPEAMPGGAPAAGLIRRQRAPNLALTS
jgi:hypothetical protein